MNVADLILVVVVEIEWGVDDRHHPVETMPTDPDDLFHAADPAVMLAVSARTLTYRQLVFDNPMKTARLDSLSPLPPHGHLRHTDS